MKITIIKLATGEISDYIPQNIERVCLLINDDGEIITDEVQRTMHAYKRELRPREFIRMEGNAYSSCRIFFRVYKVQNEGNVREQIIVGGVLQREEPPKNQVLPRVFFDLNYGFALRYTFSGIEVDINWVNR
ncbi:hypothetical protein D4R52_00295 [bacterium]|nr:MAG: hypothetical protein D4R52_00295 [bacterium]